MNLDCMQGLQRKLRQLPKRPFQRYGLPTNSKKWMPQAHWTSSLWVFTGGTKRSERKDALIESSPVFGYQFPIEIPKELFRTKQTVGYWATINNRKYTFIIKPSDKSRKGEHINNIFNILRKDVEIDEELVKKLNKIGSKTQL